MQFTSKKYAWNFYNFWKIKKLFIIKCIRQAANALQNLQHTLQKYISAMQVPYIYLSFNDFALARPPHLNSTNSGLCGIYASYFINILKPAGLSQ